MAKVRVATAWLGGCSGCHMSFLDLDEKLIDLAALIEIVWGPLVDPKEYPKDVDVALIEGAVILEENRELLHEIRKNSKLVLALGDCAITGNVPGMRNQFGRESVLEYAYLAPTVVQAQIHRRVRITPREAAGDVCHGPADAVPSIVREHLDADVEGESPVEWLHVRHDRPARRGEVQRWPSS